MTHFTLKSTGAETFLKKNDVINARTLSTWMGDRLGIPFAFDNDGDFDTVELKVQKLVIKI